MYLYQLVILCDHHQAMSSAKSHVFPRLPTLLGAVAFFFLILGFEDTFSLVPMTFLNYKFAYWLQTDQEPLQRSFSQFKIKWCQLNSPTSGADARVATEV